MDSANQYARQVPDWTPEHEHVECGHCKRGFVKEHPLQRYCEHDCRVQAARLRKRKTPMVKTCGYCRRQFRAAAFSRVYCGHSCSQGARRRRDHERDSKPLPVQSNSYASVGPIDLSDDPWANAMTPLQRVRLCKALLLIERNGPTTVIDVEEHLQSAASRAREAVRELRRRGIVAALDNSTRLKQYVLT